MEITEVRIKLVEKSAERLRAFCSITLDGDFVIRDLKIIDGVNGAFVAMPSRKLADRCTRCGSKNHLRAKYCNDCGNRLNENRAPKDSMGRSKLHADVAHPINAACRERIQNAVVKAFHEELERSKSPDYQPPKFEDFEDDVTEEFPAEAPSAAREPAAAKPVVDEAENPGDYNSLIAELKREAAGRRQKQDQTRWGPRGGERRDSEADRRSDSRGPETDSSAAPEGASEDSGARVAPPRQPATAKPVSPAPPTRSGQPDDFSSGL
jgi:stage V sporulation protein G